MNPGVSVSRVGGDAQVKFMSKISGGIKLALAQYRELAAFSQFASDLDDATRRQLEHGERINELMKQKQYAPMSVAEMGVVLFAANEGFLEDIEVGKVLDFEAALKSYMNSEQSAFMDEVNANGVYSDEVVDTMRKAIETFKSTQTW
jgi:F0F1-type ATP synthase alpha subunit